MSTINDRAQGSRHTIMKRLKAETTDYHARLESLPYFNELAEHKLPLECYVNELRSLAVIHGIFEKEITAVDDPRAVAIWNEDYGKRVLLEQDLSFFQPRLIPTADDPIEKALAMTERVRLRRIENPVTLLGYLYVLEGSTLGNNMHRPDISKTFKLDGLNGCRYYSSYRDGVHSRWLQFSAHMNEVLDDPAVHDDLIEAAHEAFTGLEVLYKSLYPMKKAGNSNHVARINPEAGSHPIPEDEREIESALKASERGWNEFGYYAMRYTDRGKRFSDSDACWLVTLSSLDQEVVQAQIDWLCRVLAARGIPSIMLEKTLVFLYEELSCALPEKTADYHKLILSAQHLKAARDTLIDEGTFESLAEQFENSVDREQAERCRNTGRLLVSAVVDEKNGIDGATEALCGWLTDSNRFPAEWIRAVKKTVGQAQNRLSE